MESRKLNVLSVSDMTRNSAVFVCESTFVPPRVSSSSSSYMVISLTSAISNGASRTPQEINILFAVLPAAICQGLFHHSSKNFKRFWLQTPIFKTYNVCKKFKMAIRNYLTATLFTIVISVSTNRKVHFYIRVHFTFIIWLYFAGNFSRYKYEKPGLFRVIFNAYLKFKLIQT